MNNRAKFEIKMGVSALAFAPIMLLSSAPALAQATAPAAEPPTALPPTAPGEAPSNQATTSTTSVNADAPQASPDDGLQEIVVTAQKRSENVQRVPAAVIAVGGAQLASQGVTDARQLSALVPAARFQQVRSQVQITVRGVGQTNSGPNADPAVATNLNGVYQLNDMTGAAFFDVDRLEVLPGPQGTLYGRNAAGGAINVFTRRPGDQLAASGSFEAGNYNTFNLEGGLDVPVTQGFALRAAGSMQRHDGYLSNGADDRRVYAGRLTAVAKPTDRLSLVLVGSYTHAGGIGDEAVNIPGVDPKDPYYYPFTTAGHFNRDNIYTVSGELNYDLGSGATLTYIGGYDHFKRHQFLDLDGGLTPAIVQTQDIAQSGTFWSHEARISGQSNKLKWLAGIYYYDSSQFYGNIVNIPGIQIVRQTPIHVDAKGVAGFGQLTYSLTDNLRLTGGIRYSNDKKEGSGDFTVVLISANRTIPSPFTGSQSKSRADWKGGLEFDLARDSMFYANVQSGFNQGGFSFAPATLGGGNEYKPMTLVAYTAGIKNRFADRKIQVNLEGYYYDYNNYQISARDLASGLNVIYNAQKAEVYGAQLDTAFLLSPHDKLTAAVGLLHAEATRLILPASVSGQRDFSGYALPSSPKATVSASYEHSFEFANGATLTPRVSTYYQSANFSAYNHFNGSRQHAYDKIDAQLAYAPESQNWSVQAFVRNLTNKATYSSVVAGSFPGPASGFIEPPRTFGGRFSFNFR